MSALLAKPGRTAVQRADCPPAPVAPAGPVAAEDPKFVAVTGGVAADARAARDHPPAEGEARKAAEAAVPPSDDKEAQAKAAHADTMSTARPSGFDRAAFIAAVTAAIEAQRPSTNEDAKNFAGSGRAAAVKSQVAGQVTAGKQTSAQDIANKTAQAPDTGAAVDKVVTPLSPPPPAPALNGPDPGKAVPDQAPAEQTELGETECTLESKMAEANVTDEQLAKSNEPEMTGAVDAKRDAVQHARTAPDAMRGDEQDLLGSARSGAAQSGRAGAAGMLSERLTQTSLAGNAQVAAQGRDEQERARIASEIKTIFDGTKRTVDGILSGLDGLVESEFNAGEKAARDAFEANHKRWMDEYEDRIGLAQWLIDKFLPTKPEVLQIFTRAAKQYEQDMKGVIARVADVIERELNRATTEISNGRDKVRAYVASQPKALQSIASEAATAIGSQFDSLDSAVKDKQQGLVEDLSERYNAARQALDKRVQELQDEHKSWRDKAVDAVDGVIETIKKLKDMLMGVLARAAGAIELIIADPIGFVGNLVSAVKTGVLNFKDNILDHLQKGLKTWLFGNLAAAGLQIPQTWDLKGVLRLILSILGLTWPAIRARILKFIPEPVLAVLETTVEIGKILVNEGPAGLWKWVQQKIGDFKEMILAEIKQMVVVEIVKAGVLWLLSLLNPASAFVKACKAIVDIIMFFVNNAAQISSLVNAVLDSVESIARGGVGRAAAMVEKALGSAVPVVLGFLAGLLGLGDIPNKIRGILAKIQEPIGKVVDSVVGTMAKVGKNLLGKLKGKRDDDSPEAKQKRLDDGLAAAVTAVNKLSGIKLVGPKLIRPALAVIKFRYKMTELTAMAQGGKWVLKGVVNPEDTKPTTLPAPDRAKVLAAVAAAQGEMGTAQAEWSKKSDPKIVFASGGGRTRQHGGGSKDEAVTETESAFRYAEAERSRNQVIAEAQKLAYLNDPLVTQEEVGRMQYDHALMRSIKKRLEAAGIFGIPRGHAFDQPRHSEGDAGPNADKRRPGSEASVHAEVLVYQLNGNPSAIGVWSLPQCGSCQSLFKGFAQAKGPDGFIVVAGADGVRIFLPDGKIRSPQQFEAEFPASG